MGCGSAATDYAFELDARTIWVAPATILSKIRTFLQRRYKTEQRFQTLYGVCWAMSVRFVEVRITGIVDSMHSWNYPAFICREIYLQYIKVDNMMIEHAGALPLFQDLDNGAPAVKPLGVTHLDDLKPHIEPENNDVLIILAAEPFVVNAHNFSPSQKSTFYIHAKVLLDEIHFCRMEYDKKQFARVALFRGTKI